MDNSLIQIVSVIVTFVLFVIMIALMNEYRGIRPEGKIGKRTYVSFAIPGIAVIMLVAILFHDSLSVGTGRTALANSILWAMEIWFILYTCAVARTKTIC